MIFHVVLLKPRPDLTGAGRDRLISAFETAVREIPTVRDVQVGRRILLGTGYEGQMPNNLDYLVTLRFDDEAGLRTYLGHSAHIELGARFADSLDAALVFDFESVDLNALR